MDLIRRCAKSDVNQLELIGRSLIRRKKKNCSWQSNCQLDLSEEYSLHFHHRYQSERKEFWSIHISFVEFGFLLKSWATNTKNINSIIREHRSMKKKKTRWRTQRGRERERRRQTVIHQNGFLLTIEQAEETILFHAVVFFRLLKFLLLNSTYETTIITYKDIYREKREREKEEMSEISGWDHRSFKSSIERPRREK